MQLGPNMNYIRSDPLPFHWLSQSTKDGITFVDIDYPELMSKKRRVIIQHEEMLRLINPVQTDTGDPAILMSSDRYMAIGCDLRNITELGSIVERRFDLDSCTVLCIAEVSMTYMDVDAADRLVKWTAQFSDGIEWTQRAEPPVALETDAEQ